MSVSSSVSGLHLRIKQDLYGSRDPSSESIFFRRFNFVIIINSSPTIRPRFSSRNKIIFPIRCMMVYSEQWKAQHRKYYSCRYCSSEGWFNWIPIPLNDSLLRPISLGKEIAVAHPTSSGSSIECRIPKSTDIIDYGQLITINVT